MIAFVGSKTFRVALAMARRRRLRLRLHSSSRARSRGAAGAGRADDNREHEMPLQFHNQLAAREVYGDAWTDRFTRGGTAGETVAVWSASRSQERSTCRSRCPLSPTLSPAPRGRGRSTQLSGRWGGYFNSRRTGVEPVLPGCEDPRSEITFDLMPDSRSD